MGPKELEKVIEEVKADQTGWKSEWDKLLEKGASIQKINGRWCFKNKKQKWEPMSNLEAKTDNFNEVTETDPPPLVDRP